MSAWLVGWFLKCFHARAEHSTRSSVWFKGETSFLLSYFSSNFGNCSLEIFPYFPIFILGSLAWELSPQLFQGSSRIGRSKVMKLCQVPEPRFTHFHTLGHKPPKFQSCLSPREWLPRVEFLHLSRKLGAARGAVGNVSLTCSSQRSGRKDLIEFK